MFSSAFLNSKIVWPYILTLLQQPPPGKCADAPAERLKKLVEFLKPLREINTLPTTRTGKVDILSMVIPAEDVSQSRFAFEDTTGGFQSLSMLANENRIFSPLIICSSLQ